MNTLRLESAAPFQGLAELVAFDEGLFEKEGIQIEFQLTNAAGTLTAERILPTLSPSVLLAGHGPSKK